jgi:hypothetical protein
MQFGVTPNIRAISDRSSIRNPAVHVLAVSASTSLHQQTIERNEIKLRACTRVAESSERHKTLIHLSYICSREGESKKQRERERERERELRERESSEREREIPRK